MRPDGDQLTQMLVDRQLGRPFTGPVEWQPIWDQLGAELAAVPDGMIVDVPFDPGEVDLEARAAAAAQVAALDAAMRPVPVKVVCWRAATAAAFPPDGDPTPYVGHHYREAGFVSVNTHRDTIVVPDGGHLLAVVVSAGVPALFDKASSELVLARTLSFRVVSVSPNGTVKVVTDA